MQKQIIDYIDHNSDALYALLADLLKYDSQNFITHGRESDCQQHVARLYEELGLDPDIYAPDSISGILEHPGYLPGRDMGNRPNVTGIWHGTEDSRPAPDGRASSAPESRVMIAAHTDTMPVGDRSKWTYDPFAGTIKDGRIYGLGAGDNKSGIAAAYFALKALKKCGVRLKKTVVLTAYVDEEYGGGDGALAACLKYPCDAYVNLDGGNFELWTCALGGGGFEIEVKAGFTTDTVTPVVDVMNVVKDEIEAMGQARRGELHRNKFYAGTDMERSAFRLLQFTAGSFGSELNSGKLIFVIYTDKTKDEIDQELRDLSDSIRQKILRSGFTTAGFKPVTRFFDYIETSPESRAAAVMAKAAEATCGAPVRQTGACLSDLSIFLKYGSSSSFNFGILRDFSLPGGAHQPDEYVACDQLTALAKAVALFLIDWCGIADHDDHINLEVTI